MEKVDDEKMWFGWFQNSINTRFLTSYLVYFWTQFFYLFLGKIWNPIFMSIFTDKKDRLGILCSLFFFKPHGMDHMMIFGYVIFDVSALNIGIRA